MKIFIIKGELRKESQFACGWTPVIRHVDDVGQLVEEVEQLTEQGYAELQNKSRPPLPESLKRPGGQAWINGRSVSAEEIEKLIRERPQPPGEKS